jgi:hypothetical protein
MPEAEKGLLAPTLRFAALLTVCGLSLVWADRAGAFQDRGLPPATLDVQRGMVGKLAAEVLGRSSLAAGEKIFIRVEPAADSWITQEAFVQSARAAGHEVLLADSAAAVRIEIRAPSVNVRYSDAFQDGLFGTRWSVRTAGAGFSCLVARGSERRVVVSDAFTASASDTVRVDDLPALESSSVASTRGAAPSEGFIDRIVEPFIIVGATGVAVYLLFNIRSSS